MFKTILVPLDGSTLAEQALEPANQIARQNKAEIVLVRVPQMEAAYATAASPYDVISLEPADGRTIAEARDYLKTIQSRQATRGVPVRAVVAEGDTAGAIVDVASQIHADLIAMSSHGYSGLTRWLLGSVAEKVLRAATCPVLVVRSHRVVRQVVITLDGSELSTRVLEPALATAAGLGASVTLLRVVPEYRVAELNELDQFEVGLGPRLVGEMRDEAEVYLHNVIERVQKQGLQVNCEVCTGSPANAILEYAESHAIDLIAMATHGRSGLQRWVYGSVTEKVLRAGGFSMLVVRPLPSAQAN